MPLPLAAVAAISAAPALAQGITGFVQSKRAKDILRNLQRPTYQIPNSATEALNTARVLASTNQLPNQVQAEQSINQSAANANYNITQNATSGTEALAAMMGVAGGQMSAMNELSGMGANFANQQNQNLINSLNRYASYEDKAFQLNQFEPYMMKLQEGQALAAAGMQNKFNALNNLAGIGANMAGSIGKSGVPSGGGTGFITPNTAIPNSFSSFEQPNLTIKSALLDANTQNMLDAESEILKRDLNKLGKFIYS